jgi:peptide/nickel transport system permease protein
LTVITHNLPSQAATALVPENTRFRGLALAWERLSRTPSNKVCLTIIAIYLLIGLVTLLPAPRQVPVLRSIPGLNRLYSFDDLIDFQFNADQTYAPPSLTFTDENKVVHYAFAPLFGLDFQGHSVFWRVLYGMRTALLITILACALSLSIGTVTGIVAGYFGGWIDDIITWIYSVLNTIPWLLLVIAVTYALQQNAGDTDQPKFFLWAGNLYQKVLGNIVPTDILIVILALGLTDWVGLCRLIRGETIRLRDADFIQAGRALGLSEVRLLFRHILPNVSHLIIITFTLGAIGYLQVEVILAFLGLGVNSKPSWGRMIDDAKLTLIRGVWWEVTAATVAIFIICLALSLLGDSLRDALDPKMRGRD